METHLSSILTNHEDTIRRTFGPKMTNHLSAKVALQKNKTLMESRETVSVNNGNGSPTESMEFTGTPEIGSKDETIFKEIE